jgi:hypothetical protein
MSCDRIGGIEFVDTNVSCPPSLFRTASPLVCSPESPLDPAGCPTGLGGGEVSLTVFNFGNSCHALWRQILANSREGVGIAADWPCGLHNYIGIELKLNLSKTTATTTTTTTRERAKQRGIGT